MMSRSILSSFLQYGINNRLKYYDNGHCLLINSINIVIKKFYYSKLCFCIIQLFAQFYYNIIIILIMLIFYIITGHVDVSD
jgi:hypothetical protein